MHASLPMRILEGIDPAALPLAALVEAGDPVVLRGIATDWPLVRPGWAGCRTQWRTCAASMRVRPSSTRSAAPRSGAPVLQRGLHPVELRSTARWAGPGAGRDRHDAACTATANLLRGLAADRAGTATGIRAGQRRRSGQAGHRRHRQHLDRQPGDGLVPFRHTRQPRLLRGGAARVHPVPARPDRQSVSGPARSHAGGQVVSVVDFEQPDFDRHPRFREALAHARRAVLGPGDAIFIPSMWWHHVRSLEPFNVLVNYWWRSSPTWLGSALAALHHAMWAVRDLPAREKQAWEGLFRYYAFGPGERAGSTCLTPRAGIWHRSTSSAPAACARCCWAGSTVERGHHVGYPEHAFRAHPQGGHCRWRYGGLAGRLRACAPVP